MCFRKILTWAPSPRVLKTEMSGHERIFTPKAIEIIRGLVAEGKSAAEIAQEIGSTAASVRVKCCQLKIKLRRPRDGGPVRTHPHHPHRRRLIVYLSPTTYIALKRHAYNMQKSVVELAELLLHEIVSSNIYDAVLDEGEE